MPTIYINTDGGSRGNPGPAAIGGVFFDEAGNEIYHFKKCIGIATNNDAEYQAIINALVVLKKSKWFVDNNHDGANVVCRLDSQLVVEQINGNYKVKQPHIQEYIGKIRLLMEDLKLNISFVHIVREENKIADKLVNEALDNELKGEQK